MISDNNFDRIYNLALKSGAIGGKLLGAGGGGFFLFIVKKSEQKNLKIVWKIIKLKIFQFHLKAHKL